MTSGTYTSYSITQFYVPINVDVIPKLIKFAGTGKQAYLYSRRSGPDCFYLCMHLDIHFYLYKMHPEYAETKFDIHPEVS